MIVGRLLDTVHILIILDVKSGNQAVVSAHNTNLIPRVMSIILSGCIA